MHRFVAVFKRDKHSPPPLVTDHAHSSASSSSGSASLCLQTPDDDQHLPAAVERQASRTSWRRWLRSSLKKTQHADWVPLSHDVDDVPSESSLHDDPPADPLQALTVLVQNSLCPPSPPPAPFACRSDYPSIFPKSANRMSLLPRSHSLASLTLKRHILKRLQDERHAFSESELCSIAPLASRPITPVVPSDQPQHPFNVSAPSKSIAISTSCPGLGTWVSRPCFEDRYDLFMPEQDGAISRRPISGSDLAVAALEFSEGIEAMVDPDPTQPSLEMSSETVSISPSSSGHSRTSPHIPAPSPLRNEHNPPAPPSVSATQSAPPAVPTSSDTDSSVKRGVRFAEDGKDDVIPLGYVLRMKKKREEKAKFLKAEQERRSLEEERMRHEEDRRKRDAERAEWERERRAWEKEKRVMEEERRQRKYAGEVLATRLRRESQRVGGVPALKASESNAFNSGAAYFPASASSSPSERNKPSAAQRYPRPAYNDTGAPAYIPRREASESNLPTRLDTNLAPSLPITPSPRSRSPSSSPPSVNVERPMSPDRSSPLPGTRPSSMNSSQEIPPPLEDVKAAVAAAANRVKRHSFAASVSTSRNNSNISLLGDRGTSYPMWTGSNHSLNVLPVAPMIHPMQMPMMPVPAYAMMDMPLLPPVPPFMMQQYPRHHGTPGSPGSGGGSPKGRLGGSSPSSSKERLDSRNPSRERVNVVTGAARSGSVERGYVSDRSNKESKSHPSRSASFPRPEAPRHNSSSPAQVSSPASPQGARHGHMQHSSPTGPSSRRTSVSQLQMEQRSRQSSHDLRPSPPTHTHSQPVLMSQSSRQNFQLSSPWTGLPTQSGNLPNGNSNGNGSRGNKNVPPRHMSYSGVRSEGVRQSNMRTDPPRQVKRQPLFS